MKMAEVYLGLIHAPVYNKNMEVITTSITNLDLHDIARCVETYGLKRYFVIHPVEAQRQLARRIMGFWREGYGAEYNPDRKAAFDRVRIVESLAEAVAVVEAEQGMPPRTVATDARKYANTITYPQLRKDAETRKEPLLLLLGTGWGLVKEDMEQMDQILEPIYGCGEYNHLSVRSAAAIILDRLFGKY